MGVATIQRLAAEHFGITVAELKGASQQRRVAHPRQLAMWLCRRHTGRSAAEIARLFGDRDHTTVLHAYRAVDERLARSGALRATVAALEEKMAGDVPADLAEDAARRAAATALRAAEEALDRKLEAIAFGLAKQLAGDPETLLARIASLALGEGFDT